MFNKLTFALTAGLVGLASSASAAVYTDQASYDAGVAAGDTTATLVNVGSATTDIATVFGAVIAVIVFIFGIRKVYGMITRS